MDSAVEKLFKKLWHILGFHLYEAITTWLEALLVNWSMLGSWTCVLRKFKTINVRK